MLSVSLSLCFKKPTKPETQHCFSKNFREKQNRTTQPVCGKFQDMSQTDRNLKCGLITPTTYDVGELRTEL